MDLRQCRIGAFLALLVTTVALSACGSGGESDVSDDDPSNSAPIVTISNGAPYPIKTLFVYEAYTGNLYEVPFSVPINGSSGVTGLVASQYDFYVYFTNGLRSDLAVTVTRDPYNDEPINRSIPRVNPGEKAVVIFDY